MTKEGRLARGKENYDSKRFLNNSETKEYVKSLKKTIVKPVKSEVKEVTPKEAEDAQPTK